MSEKLPVLLKRQLQAEVIGPVFQEMAEEFGRDKAEEVLDRAIRKAAIAEGEHFRKSAPKNQAVMTSFVELYDLWMQGGALEVDVLKQSETEFDFDVTRCRYAEMYREMGLGDIGHLLSCNRDGTFAEGFDPEMQLQREQTIMKGAPRCTFRYRLDKPGT